MAVVDFQQVRPGDRLAAYLGQAFPPSHWNEVRTASQAAVDQCVIAAGGTPAVRAPAVFPESAELRGTDLAEFRRRYGYGVIEIARTEKWQEAESPQVLSPSERVALEETAELEGKCARAGDNVIAASIAPRDVVELSQELTMRFGDDPVYLQTSSAWTDCMTSAGYMTEYGPYFSKGVIEQKLLARYDQIGRTGTAVDFDALQVMEIAAFKQDSLCLKTSGAGEVMLAFEEQILNALKLRFPNYKSPVDGLAGSTSEQ